MAGVLRALTPRLGVASFGRGLASGQAAPAAGAAAAAGLLPEVPHTPCPPFPVAEPAGPRVVSGEVPGPKSKEQLARLGAIQDVGGVKFFVDLERSVGNYVADADGNVMLDLYSHIASLPVGYNHPKMLAVFEDPNNRALLAHRPALGNAPPVGWAERVERTLMSVAPAGLTRVAPMMCGSCANENAYKAVFIAEMARRRGGAPPSAEDLSSCMSNSAPGTTDLKILSFEGAFHGRLLGCLSTTHSKPIHKLDVPAFDWPTAPFPRLKYPLGEHAQENAAEEARCLAEVERLLDADKDTVGLIVEPIQAEGGDNHASASFFKGLQKACKARGVKFIVDEVQTGCAASGTFWMHEQWGLPSPPDVVTFSKKMQIAGYFCGPELVPTDSYRIFNTWMGDPVRLLQLEAVVNEVRDAKLTDNAAVTGRYLLDGLEALQARHPSVLSNARGVGTLCAVDFPDAATRDAMVTSLRRNGVDIPTCGERTLRTRPGLFFRPDHAAVFLERFAECLAEADAA